ncbi:NmrA/HSCARG family protein [Nonomuraea purpurea]|uniref:NmrA/HSCARG family protein n=1 Tax=Nonomuraea purpurea TaxID=1849276 RepID=A0ABV8G6Y7_9ACTN
MTAEGTIFVIGATGRQGGAVARELLRRGRPVRALTRTPDSPAAKDLAAQGAAVVHGDLEDPASLRDAMAGAHGVFSVQTFLTDAGLDGEVRQGRVVAEAAKELNVAHVVYTSVDGAERDSGVPHFESKWTIERHLQALKVPTTVLRPVFFMENFVYQPPQSIDGVLTVRLALPARRPLQMIATADIGAVAADAFDRPEEYIGQAVALAGDELTGPEIAAAFEEATTIPASYEEQPLAEIRGFSEDLTLMFEWFDSSGYQADIAELRERHPGLRTLRDWLRETAWQPATGN